MQFRVGSKEDLKFIKEMLFEACFWNPNMLRPEMEQFFKNEDICKLISNWGRIGDRVVIVEDAQDLIGVAWYRLWTEDNHSYGFIDAHIPELGIGIRPEHRSKGIGRMLLRKLISMARDDGFRALSLSVDPNNFARILYESEGFVKVGESGTSWTCKLEL